MEAPPPDLIEPDFPRDSSDTPVVPQFLVALPLYARVLALLSGSACWLQRKLSAPGPLLMQRIELFVDRLFRVAADFALVSALDLICLALCEFAEAAWEALLHLNTSPKPSLAVVVPEVGSWGHTRFRMSCGGKLSRPTFWRLRKLTTSRRIPRVGRVGCPVLSVSSFPLSGIWEFSESSLPVLRRRFFHSLSLSHPVRSALYCLAWGEMRSLRIHPILPYPPGRAFANC